MSSPTQPNNFSLISRLFGNLFYRSPQDPILANVFDWLVQQGLTSLWGAEMDKIHKQALSSLQMPLDLTVLAQEYYKLFGTAESEAKINPRLSNYGIDVAKFIAFRQSLGLPELENADHFALLLLTASWIEDNRDSTQAQKELFEQFLLPCAGQFLSQVETKASLPFYRSLALLCKDILMEMSDELEESEA
ncbi:molecular chaperone [[Haemophilus] felis]|uniref:Molecular chaperone n=1 Tax=[Haemophilus] felis TaxID=123822 RepID=A0A1T0AXP2_9PAST|nr:molecular chaperone [[Haemophilus] felis]OOS02121.1 hypothetical protein B0188_09160 [[Haemophilus] felis]